MILSSFLFACGLSNTEALERLSMFSMIKYDTKKVMFALKLGLVCFYSNLLTL